MNLDITNWKPFRIDKIFDVYTGGDLIMSEIEEGDIPIASNSAENNNIAAYTLPIKGRKLFDHTKSISIADRGKFWAFIQPKDFYIATRVKALVCREYNMLNIYQLAFIVSVLNQESFKFTYGRNCCANLPNINISLPIQEDCDNTPIFDNQKRYSEEGYIPDWIWMENYIRSLHHKPLTTKNIDKTAPNLNTNSWKYFYLKDICSITMGNKMDYSAMSVDNPSVNFVGRSADNNGVAGKVDFVIDDKGDIVKPYKAGCITVALGGSLGSSYLQVEDFYTSQNVSVLEFEDLVSDSAKLFITTCIMNESKYKYFPFGRELNTHIRTDFGFTLPIQRKANGEPIIDDTHKYSPQGYIPDWKWMDHYIKSLPYGDRL